MLACRQAQSVGRWRTSWRFKRRGRDTEGQDTTLEFGLSLAKKDVQLAHVHAVMRTARSDEACHEISLFDGEVLHLIHARMGFELDSRKPSVLQRN